MKLYAYWRSSASWRVRIGLALKGIDVDVVPVDLLADEQRSAAHVERSPLGQVPVLELASGERLTQSLAILQYLDAIAPEPPLFPADPLGRARVMALAEVVNAGIQPLQNLRVLAAVHALGGDKAAWGHDAIRDGLVALQRLAAPHAGQYLHGDAVSAADACLIPQLYNARRFQVDLTPFGLLTAVEARCAALPAFQRAHPDRQPDARS